MSINAITPLAPSLAPTPDSASSDGTSGKLFDENALPKPDPETQEEIIGKVGNSAKDGQGLLNQVLANAPENNQNAIDLAIFSGNNIFGFFKKSLTGLNGIAGNNENARLLAQQQAAYEGESVGGSVFLIG